MFWSSSYKNEYDDENEDEDNDCSHPLFRHCFKEIRYKAITTACHG